MHKKTLIFSLYLTQYSSSNCDVKFSVAAVAARSFKTELKLNEDFFKEKKMYSAELSYIYFYNNNNNGKTSMCVQCGKPKNGKRKKEETAVELLSERRKQ